MPGYAVEHLQPVPSPPRSHVFQAHARLLLQCKGEDVIHQLLAAEAGGRGPRAISLHFHTRKPAPQSAGACCGCCWRLCPQPATAAGLPTRVPITATTERGVCAAARAGANAPPPRPTPPRVQHARRPPALLRPLGPRAAPMTPAPPPHLQVSARRTPLGEATCLSPIASRDAMEGRLWAASLAAIAAAAAAIGGTGGEGRPAGLPNYAGLRG